MYSQKIALFGNSGENSRLIAKEALRRGHYVTAIVLNERYFTLKHPNLKVISGDVRKNYEVSKLSTDYDAVICAHEPVEAKPREHVYVTRAVIEGVKDSGVRRLIFAVHRIGHPIERTEEAYDGFKPILKAQQEALKILKNENLLQWGYVHSIVPEAVYQEGKYQNSNEILFTTPEGENRLQEKEYSSVILDEIEKYQIPYYNESLKGLMEINI